MSPGTRYEVARAKRSADDVAQCAPSQSNPDWWQRKDSERGHDQHGYAIVAMSGTHNTCLCHEGND